MINIPTFVYKIIHFKTRIISGNTNVFKNILHKFRSLQNIFVKIIFFIVIILYVFIFLKIKHNLNFIFRNRILFRVFQSIKIKFWKSS